MRATIGCSWPKGISRGSVLAACCEGSRRCRSRTGSEAGETANRALRNDPVGASVSGQAGWRRETDQTSQRNRRTSRDAARGQLCRSELDARGRQAYGLRAETKLKSEIPLYYLFKNRRTPRCDFSARVFHSQGRLGCSSSAQAGRPPKATAKITNSAMPSTRT